MTDKDIEKIYNDLEKYLINNIKRNLTSDLDSFHLNEEKQLGFKWEAWQSAKLRELKRYRRQNKTIINKRLKNISSKIAQVLRNEQLQGKLDAFKNYKAALTHGYKSSIKVKDSFFKINDRKVNTLIKSVNNDFSEANRAVLRRSNDVYRQIIVEASMYNQTGVMTERQAIKKAIDDFQSRGIDCIVYSNGARHKISNYASMAIRTASTRAHLQGEGQLRQKIKEPLILMSKHNTACKLCQPFEGKVLIDDVYSGGTKEDGKYTLLSEAMKQGLYHPNCRHGLGTYYKELGKNVSDDIIEEVDNDNNDIVFDNEGRLLTQEQQRYFKDSKVRDKDGNLITMYHGSVSEFDIFDKNKIREVDYDAPFNGFWFSNDPNTSPAMTNAKTTMEVYLNIKNPAPYNVYNELEKQVTSELYDGTNAEKWKKVSRSINDEVRYRLEDMGYDGVHWEGQPDIDWNVFKKQGQYTYKTVRGNYYTIVNNEGYIDLYDGKNVEDGEYLTNYLDKEDFEKLHKDEVWVAFEPEQIKRTNNLKPTKNKSIDK